MTGMPAISLHQPHASLCVTRQAHDFNRCRCDQWGRCLVHCGTCTCVFIKRFETRSWPCPPNLIGQRIALHATLRRPEHEMRVGGYEVWHLGHHLPALSDGLTTWPLPLGAIVGSATIEACLPIVRPVFGTRPCIWIDQPLSDAPPRLLLWTEGQEYGDNISDQLPFGDWTPGRYAWLLTDAAPTNERCPWCWGKGTDPAYCYGAGEAERTGRKPWRHFWGALPTCPVCKNAGDCEPIPARGRQRIWQWTP